MIEEEERVQQSHLLSPVPLMCRPVYLKMKVLPVKHFLLGLLIVIALQMHRSTSCVERTALLEMKAFLISVMADSGYADGVLPSWVDDGKSDCCHWEQVKCNATTRRVVELALNDSINYSLMNPYSRKNFSDGFPLLNLSLLHPFEELQSLNLSNNFCGGWFDDNEGSESFAGLKKLEILDLSHNSFNSSILPFLSAATSLRTLNLGNNEIAAVLPLKEFSSLRNMRILDLSSNRFELLPGKGLANLKKLEALDLSSNFSPGNLEMLGICELRNLRELDLSYNELSGPLPHCLSNLTHLRVLDATSNRFTGNLQSVVSNLTSLQHLSLYDNNFEGSLSLSSLAKHSNLKVFRLSSKSGMLEVKAEGYWLPTFQLQVLQLPNCNINGTFPGFLMNQYDLQFIDLSHNKLVGEFPAWLLHNNSKLEDVYLSNNSFTDFQVPKVMHGLLRLEVSHNHFTGSLPENIGIILPELVYVNLSQNLFRGGIPSAMGELKSLLKLDLTRNNFSGELPKNFVSGCSSLQILKLSDNNFGGQIFPEYANLTELQWLLLDNNKFSGGIGKGLLKSVSLGILDISNNMLSGRLPDWIGKFASLSIILIGKNQLESELPVQLRNLSNLSILDLSENRFSGSIPSSFSLSNLNYLYLQNNYLTGSIPDTLFESKGLVTLDLRNNRLSGSIPNSVGELSELSVFLLRGNHIRGHIPDEICQLRKVNFFDVSHNKFHGSVPSCLNNMSFGTADDGPSQLSSMYSMGMAFVLDKYYEYTPPNAYNDEFIAQIIVEFATKSRYESFEGGILPDMYGLDLSSNELVGDIPIQIGDLQKLRTLNLSHNHFSGSIPERFSNLKNIESLDLSYNLLHGRIPPDLAELYSLAVFNVSFNNLSGLIPFKGQFAAFDGSQYIGNSGLCGLPTNRTCGNTEITTTQYLEREDDDAVIDVFWFYWSFGTTYVTILLVLFVFLCIDSRWSRAWFYLVDVCIYHFQHLKPVYVITWWYFSSRRKETYR